MLSQRREAEVKKRQVGVRGESKSQGKANVRGQKSVGEPKEMGEADDRGQGGGVRSQRWVVKVREGQWKSEGAI